MVAHRAKSGALLTGTEYEAVDAHFDAVVDHGNLGATEEFDVAAGSFHRGTVNASVAITLAGATANELALMTIKLTNDGTGGYALDLSGSGLVNADDLEADYDPTASAVQFLTVFSDIGGSDWYGTWLAGPSTGILYSGTSFPVSPAAGDRFRRTDIDYMIFVYDGTRWVSEQMFTMTGTERALNAGASTTSPTRFKQTPLHNTRSIYIVRVDVAWFVASPNSGSAYWTLDIKNVAESTTHVTLNTSAMSANTWTKQAWTTGAVVPASDIGLMWMLTKTGSPGAFTCAPSLYYRIIAT